jgi:hypothetical protein
MYTRVTLGNIGQFFLNLLVTLAAIWVEEIFARKSFEKAVAEVSVRIEQLRFDVGCQI